MLKKISIEDYLVANGKENKHLKAEMGRVGFETELTLKLGPRGFDKTLKSFKEDQFGT